MTKETQELEYFIYEHGEVTASLLNMLKILRALAVYILMQNAVDKGKIWKSRVCWCQIEIQLLFCSMKSHNRLQDTGALSVSLWSEGFQIKQSCSQQLQHLLFCVLCPTEAPLESSDCQPMVYMCFGVERNCSLGLTGYLLWNNLKGKEMCCLLRVIFLSQTF